MPYTEITYQEFQRVMTDQGFQINTFDLSGEYVFDRYVEYKGASFIVRVYSSVDKRYNKTRNVGTDAIRVVILNAAGYMMRGNKRVNRVETWKENLQKRLDNWIGVADLCPQCGMPLQNKKGRWGNFIGCSAFPTCGYTTKKQ